MGRYDDILFCPHPVSSARARMAEEDRAAQFAPFAALTGHDSAIAETARLTDSEIELDESRKEILNRKLQYLLSILHTQPEITVTWFCPDKRKTGGAYVQTTGKLKKIDAYPHEIHLIDQPPIPMEQVYGIEIPDTP